MISDKMRIDAEAAYYLSKSQGLEVTPFTAKFKGFAENEYRLWRVGKKS